jgi:hypothetical protein
LVLSGIGCLPLFPLCPPLIGHAPRSWQTWAAAPTGGAARFTALAAGRPELLAAAEYASLDDDARAAYDGERLDYHTRLGVVGTSVLRQVISAAAA